MTGALKFDFSSKRALIIGASRGGIGTAIARGLVEAGADVSITGAEAEPISELRGRFNYNQLNVTDTDAIRSLAEATPGIGRAGQLRRHNVPRQ